VRSSGTGGARGLTSPSWPARNRRPSSHSAISKRPESVAIHTDERLTTYLSLARRHGVDDQALTALMILLTAYVGQPYTSLAMEAIHRSSHPERLLDQQP